MKVMLYHKKVEIKVVMMVLIFAVVVFI